MNTVESERGFNTQINMQTEQFDQPGYPMTEPPKPRKSRFTGTSIFEREQKKKEARERKERRRRRSRSRSNSRDRGEKENVDENDPNNVHKQCERAAAEARRRAMVLLKDRGLLDSSYNVDMEAITTTVINPDIDSANPTEQSTATAATDANNTTEGMTETSSSAGGVNAQSTSQSEATPAIQSAMSKLLAAKEKENQSGVLSWYKPADGASTIKSVLEKENGEGVGTSGEAENTEN